MKNDKLTIYKADDGWRWRYTSANGNIMADGGQGYSRRADAHRGALRVTGINRKTGLDVEVVR
jgi:uncharacterized protein YegP (UPF0339 family)